MTLRVSVLELPATWNRRDRMLEAVDASLAERPTDFLVLPEASLFGYVSPDGNADLSPFAEDADGPTSGSLARLAARHRVHLVGPLVLRDGVRLYNAAVCFGPRGERVFTYRKRHPWYPETWASPGEAPLPQAKVGGLTVSAAICFDVHFLEEESAEQLEAADLLVFPSAWVETGPEDTRVPQLRALAQRFGCAVANANWGPGLPPLPGQGGSCIIGRDGDVLAAVAPGQLRADAVLATG